MGQKPDFCGTTQINAHAFSRFCVVTGIAGGACCRHRAAFSGPFARGACAGFHRLRLADTLPRGLLFLIITFDLAPAYHA
jgi:hypothetical protein